MAPDEPKTPAGSAGAGTPQQQAVQVPVDTTGMVSHYVNWYRVSGTPEELILDFGLNPEHGQIPTQPIKLTDRLVMSFYTAKRLLQHLQFAVARHESFFGVIELDFQRRAQASGGGMR
jgi:hypothetical protein